MLGDPPDLLATNLAFSVGGAALEDFRGLVRASSWPHGKFRATGQLTVAGGTLHLSKLQASVADAQGIISADFALPLDAAAVSFEIDARLPDLARLLPKLNIAAAAGKNLRAIATGSRLKDRWTLTHLRLESATGLIDTHGELDLAPRIQAKDASLEFRLASLMSARCLRNASLAGPADHAQCETFARRYRHRIARTHRPSGKERFCGRHRRARSGEQAFLRHTP